jgi:hypothetical protein
MGGQVASVAITIFCAGAFLQLTTSIIPVAAAKMRSVIRTRFIVLSPFGLMFSNNST